MAQFSVYRNGNPATRKAIPLLLDIQCDLISDLATRVVVPLYPARTMKLAELKTLTPRFQIEGTGYLMVTPQLAGVSVKALGERVADLSDRRQEIIAAIDLLVTGI
jgi:toxin CcdB